MEILVYYEGMSKKVSSFLHNSTQGSYFCSFSLFRIFMDKSVVMKKLTHRT